MVAMHLRTFRRNCDSNEGRGVSAGEPDSNVARGGILYQLYTHHWFQIFLISMICFCCPGMYNALAGLGGSGQVNSTVAANGNVALLSATAVTAIFVAGPVFERVGPRICLLIGGWTYPLYSGSLLCFNHTQNGGFVIAAGAILGIGAAFLWVSQGAIMTTYVPESQKGRAIAVFWIIFNLGGGVGSFASFGLNYHSSSGTASDGTYIALMVIMGFGWFLGVFICSPKSVRVAQLQLAQESEKRSFRKVIAAVVETVSNWRIISVLPIFFCANLFYSYQQNFVNGEIFNIRSRSLNGALYWLAQMVGGLIMGVILDLPWFSRPTRAKISWAFVFSTGMVIWGGGYAFQKWADRRLASGHKQDLDYTHGTVSTGPMFLYIFYGGYDAFWQSFCYWMIGTQSNSPAVAAILVGTYKSVQAAGGAMAWRINAQGKPAVTQFAMNWGMCMGCLVLAIPAVLAVTNTSTSEGTELDQDKSTGLDDGKSVGLGEIPTTDVEHA